MRPRGSPEELERRRRRAMKLIEQGVSMGEVARMVGVKRRSVERWRKARREGGIRLLRAKRVAGRPPKLTAEDRKQLESLLLEGARANGFATDLWTCPRIASIIWDRFGVAYHVDHIPKLLHQLGWSVQKPTRRAIERDEAEIRRWTKREWPRVKKTPSRTTR